MSYSHLHNWSPPAIHFRLPRSQTDLLYNSGSRFELYNWLLLINCTVMVAYRLHLECLHHLPKVPDSFPFGFRQFRVHAARSMNSYKYLGDKIFQMTGNYMTRDGEEHSNFIGAGGFGEVHKVRA